MSDKGGEERTPYDARLASDRRLLWSVLLINLGQFTVGLVIGMWADSMAVIGVALDNLADASVYAVSLYAVGRSIAAKVRAARLSGWLLLGLSAAASVEVLRRFFGAEAPIGAAMIGMAALNAALNVVCLRILSRHRGSDVTFRASAVFTSNDSIINLSIIVSGVLVIWLGTSLPDLVLGLAAAVIAAMGGREILQEAAASERDHA